MTEDIAIKIERLKEYIKESKRIVFFGGAGVSTESGVPDFRSEDGLYSQSYGDYTPEYLLSRECLYHEPKVFFKFYKEKMDTRDIKPNITHYVLANLENRGKLKSIVTQNIDGLHQKAGSKVVHEIHGTTRRCYCTKCSQEFDGDYIFDSKDLIPKCPNCGGMLRPDVTLYGETLPGKACDEAIEDIHNADMLIIGGTSLSVWPANSYVYHFWGDRLVVINKEPIDFLLGGSDIIFESSLGEVFEQLEGSL